MATAAERDRAAAGSARLPDAHRDASALPTALRRLLAVAIFLLLFAGFSLVPALQGLSLSAGQSGAAPEPAARAADMLAATQAQALAARP